MSQISHKDYHSQTVRKSKTKKKILEVGGKKQNLIYQETRIRNTVNFLPETIQATREKTRIFKLFLKIPSI